MAESFAHSTALEDRSNWQPLRVHLEGVANIAASFGAELGLESAALNSAGHHYDGHTGMLADLTGCKSSGMLLASPMLNVIHVSTHS